MEAIILAGGFGTRLKHIVADVPKPMAPVNDRPFLEYVMEYLLRENVTKVIMATGYKEEVIRSYFGDLFHGMQLIYSNEETPLGTGGAIKKAMELCSEDNVFVINGDTFFDVHLSEMMNFHLKKKSDATVAAKKMYHYSRYGTLICKDEIICEFMEKSPTDEGLINGGIYIVNKSVFKGIKEECFSIEADIFESKHNDIRISAFMCEGYFIDIGVPEDYYKAQEVFKRE